MLETNPLRDSTFDIRYSNSYTVGTPKYDKEKAPHDESYKGFRVIHPNQIFLRLEIFCAFYSCCINDFDL
jgi:hypothetical protein